MSQTKRKVKIRQHIAQLHIKTQAVNCPNFKQKKAETKTTCDQMRRCKTCERVSEAEHTKLQEAHKKSVQKLGEITGMYIRKNEVLEGENAKLKNEIAEERTGNEFLNTENLALMGDCVAYQKRLEAIKSLYENRPKRRPFIKGMKGEECYLDGEVDEFLKELGVLLSPKEVDSNQTLSSHQCWLTHSPLGCSWVDCQDCPMRELEYYGGLERKFKELDQKTREGDSK